MTELAALLAAVLSGFAGMGLGFFRSAVGAGIGLVSGVGAFGMAGPIAGAIGSSDPMALVGIVAAVFLGCVGFLALSVYALTPGRVRVPWLMDRVGGVCCGAAVGWMVAGLAIAALRSVDPFDDYVRRTRPAGSDYAFRHADGAWTQIVAFASTRGLARAPRIAYSPKGFVQQSKGTRGDSSREED